YSRFSLVFVFFPIYLLLSATSSLRPFIPYKLNTLLHIFLVHGSRLRRSEQDFSHHQGFPGSARKNLVVRKILFGAPQARASGKTQKGTAIKWPTRYNEKDFTTPYVCVCRRQNCRKHTISREEHNGFCLFGKSQRAAPAPQRFHGALYLPQRADLPRPDCLFRQSSSPRGNHR